MSGARFSIKKAFRILHGGIKNVGKNFEKVCQSLPRAAAAFGAGTLAVVARSYGPIDCVLGSALLAGTDAWLSGADKKDILKEGFKASKPKIGKSVTMQSEKHLKGQPCTVEEKGDLLSL